MNDRTNESIARRIYGKETALTKALTRWRSSKGKAIVLEQREIVIIGGYLKFRLSKSSNFQARLANSIENRLTIITASQSLFLLYRIYLQLRHQAGLKIATFVASREVSLRVFLDEEVFDRVTGRNADKGRFT